MQTINRRFSTVLGGHLGGRIALRMPNHAGRDTSAVFVGVIESCSAFGFVVRGLEDNRRRAADDPVRPYPVFVSYVDLYTRHVDVVGGKPKKAVDACIAFVYERTWGAVAAAQRAERASLEAVLS